MKNYRRLANTGIVGVAFLLVLMTAGCVKKRPAAFDQGQGIDAQEVSSLSTKFTLTTGEPISGANGSEATSVEVSSDLMHAMNKFPLVTYETNCPLLGQDLPFRAKPHHQYEIRYQATDQNLIILKVAKKEDLPSDEWPYAQALENDLIGVPLVGYPIRYFSVQKRVNEDNKPTSRLIEIPVVNRAEASHFRIDRASPTISQAEAKIDVYPVSYFRGEWYYESTIIDAKIGQEDKLGNSVGMDTRLNPATRVNMVFDSKSSLAGVNANHDERIDKDDRLNQAYVFSIPIEWKDYRVQKFGREAGISEEAYTEKEVTQRPFIHLKFREINTPDDAIASLFKTLSLDMSKLPGGERRLLDLKFSQDFFSFTILRGESGVKVRYAFRRIPEGVPVLAARPFNREDTRKFGYFVSKKHVIYDRHIQRQADIDAVGMMSRFNPMKKEIVYHFSNQTPAKGSTYGWTREMARYAIHFWDQAFQMAGAPTRIRLDESKDVDVGDTRYNVINLVNPIASGGWHGFGPRDISESCG